MKFRILQNFGDAQLQCLPESMPGGASSAFSSNKHKGLDAFWSQLQKAKAGTLVWPPGAAAEAYHLLSQVDSAGWSSAKACTQFANALQHHGTLCVQYLTTQADQSDTADSEGSLGLTIFLICHVLQKTEAGDFCYTSLLLCSSAS